MAGVAAGERVFDFCFGDAGCLGADAQVGAGGQALDLARRPFRVMGGHVNVGLGARLQRLGVQQLRGDGVYVVDVVGVVLERGIQLIKLAIASAVTDQGAPLQALLFGLALASWLFPAMPSIR